MQVLGALGGAGILALVIRAVRENAALSLVYLDPKSEFGTVKQIGQQLFTRYLLPFEAASLLLLVAIVGAVVISKEKI